MKKESNGKWEEIDIPICDICGKTGKFMNSLGGIRCAKCPRPGDEKKGGA